MRGGRGTWRRSDLRECNLQPFVAHRNHPTGGVTRRRLGCASPTRACVSNGRGVDFDKIRVAVETNRVLDETLYGIPLTGHHLIAGIHRVIIRPTKEPAEFANGGILQRFFADEFVGTTIKPAEHASDMGHGVTCDHYT